MTLTELLNEAKKRTGSDPKTAEVIGVSKGALSGVRAGSRPLPIDAAERLAELLDVPWHAVIAASVVPAPVMIVPTFSVPAIFGIALPLFIVTMASQNIPGIAVLKSNDYELDPGPGFTLTGLFSVLSAPFGGHAVNLAAITAAMCAGEEAHPDRERRYWAAVISGVAYICFGLMAGAVTAFVALAPAILIQAVAGLALIGAFVKATVDAFEEVPAREASAVTFLFSAAGISVAGISGAFWGLLAGGLVLLGKNLLKRGEK